MSGKQCELCGKRITIWNQAWGTTRCRRCATGKSPQAVKEKNYATLEQHPYKTEQDIQKSAGGFLVGAFVFALVVDVVAQVVPGGWSFIVLGVGLAGIGGKMIFADTHLLNQRRWNAFAIANFLFWLLGFMLFTSFASFAKVQSTVHGQPPNVSADLFRLFWYGGIPVFASLAAVVVAAAMEKRHVRRVSEIYRQWQSAKTEKEGSANKSTESDKE